jgi:kynurenine formamidase
MLRDLGAHLIEFLNLEELARDKVNEFLFITAPLKITGGIGSPINPLAIV